MTIGERGGKHSSEPGQESGAEVDDLSTRLGILADSNRPRGRERIAELLDRYRLSAAEVATAVGAPSTATVLRWREVDERQRRSRYDDRIEDLLAAIEYIESLAGRDKPELVATYLRRPNAYLDRRRPIEVLGSDRGGLQEIAAAIESAQRGDPVPDDYADGRHRDAPHDEDEPSTVGPRPRPRAVAR